MTRKIVLGIDPGTRNMGICFLLHDPIIHKKNRAMILGWTILDVKTMSELRPKKKGGSRKISDVKASRGQGPTKNLLFNIVSIFDWIFLRRPDLIPDLVVIEEQYRNKKMSNIVHFLSGYFIGKYKWKVTFKKGNERFRLGKRRSKTKTQYRRNKEDSVYIAKDILSENPKDKVWLEFIKGFPKGKNDDLSDSYLHGLTECV